MPGFSLPPPACRREGRMRNDKTFLSRFCAEPAFIDTLTNIPSQTLTLLVVEEAPKNHHLLIKRAYSAAWYW
jgi:hypothetical protein